MNYLPSNLRYLRTRKKMSQTELGRLLGRDHTTVSGYESGKRTPSLSDISKITEIFHVSTHDLINDDLSIYAQNQKSPILRAFFVLWWSRGVLTLLPFGSFCAFFSRF